MSYSRQHQEELLQYHDETHLERSFSLFLNMGTEASDRITYLRSELLLLNILTVILLSETSFVYY